MMMEEEEAEEGIGIEGLGDLAIQVILSKLDPNDTARVSCVSKRFRGWASDDYFWSILSSNDLNLSSPVDPFGNPVPSFKVQKMVLIYDLTNSNYVDFIRELREQARDKEKLSHGRPILPLDADSLPSFIHVNLLIGGTDKGSAKIRRFRKKMVVLVYHLTSKNYLRFIRELREEAREKDTVCHGRPILPLETDCLPAFIYLKLLIGGEHKGLVKIRRYDLALISYRDPLGNVIHVDDFNLYDDESRLLESAFDGLLLGLPTFIQAVNDISQLLDKSVSNVVAGISFLVVSCDRRNNCNVRSCLAVLCVVLAEAAKFELISCWLSKAFKANVEVRLTSWLLNRINDWGHLSGVLLEVGLHIEYEDDAADCNCYISYHKNGWNDERRVLGVTCQNIARCLGILRAVPHRPPVATVELFRTNTSLAEVYSVSVVFNGGRSGFIYGTIKIINAYDTLYIYARDPTNYEPIESHDTLSLHDPETKNFILVNGILEMEFDLREGGGGGETDNNEVVKGKMLWDAPLRDDRYDTRLSAYVKGKNGYAIVYYTVHGEAILTVVEATLLAKDGHPDDSQGVWVCGRIAAYYHDLAYPSEILQKYYTTILFNKPVRKEPSALSECKCRQWVKPGENIELSRSSVAVEISDALIIKADLKSCEGKPIVTGSLKWVPLESGEFRHIMDGHPNDSHVLQVKVKWRKITHESN